MCGSAMRGSASPLLLLALVLLAVAPPAANAFSGLPGALNFLGTTCRRSAARCVMSAGGWSQNEVDFAAQHTVAELKGMLQSRGMPTTGRKAELIQRLSSSSLAPSTIMAPPKAPSKVAAAAVEEAKKALQVAGRWAEDGATAFLDDTTHPDGQRGSDRPPAWKLPKFMDPTPEDDAAALVTRRDVRAAARAELALSQQQTPVEITEEMDRRSRHILALKQAQDARLEEDARLAAMRDADATHAAEDRKVADAVALAARLAEEAQRLTEIAEQARAAQVRTRNHKHHKP